MPNEERKAISGRVAQVLNERELVINIGTDQGVASGMIFAVLAESPLEVIDPESRKPLDVIDREKVRVKASEVRKRISICRTYRETVIPGFDVADFAKGFRMFEPTKRIPETLRASAEDRPAPLSPEESYVKINDRVIEVPSD